MQMADGGDNTQGGRHRLLRDWTCGGSMEGDNQYNQPLVIVFYFISRRSAWFFYRERNWDRHSRGKFATTAHCYEVGGPPLYIP